MRKEQKNICFAVFSFIMGLFIFLLAIRVIPSDESKFHAPHSVVALCGVLFMLCGLALIAKNHQAIYMAIVVAMLFVFFIVVVWLCVFTRPEDWSGGLPYVSPKVNGWIAKTLAGIGAVALVYMLVKAIQKLRQIMTGGSDRTT